MMRPHLELWGLGAALLTSVVGGTVIVENRYAKAVDVKEQLNAYYARGIKTRILELQLKPPAQFTSSDRALLDHLQQELREATAQ